MMAWLQMWIKGLMATLALSSFIVTAQNNGLQGVTERKDLVGIVKKESHPVLRRQKREWIWNSLFVEEEKEVTSPIQIGQLKSSLKVAVKKFAIDGDEANTTFTVDDTGALYLTRSLDREKRAIYNLTAKMFDGNMKLIEDSGDFAVQVTDINDNKPKFNETIQYKGSVAERSSEGTKVIQVTATDADDPTSANGQLKYTLIGGHTSHFNVPAFEIDPTSGWISCKISSLDRETKSKYVVVVQAQDLRGIEYGLKASTNVTIVITDINDNIASFTKNTYKLEVPENSKLNEMIGTVTLQDRDEIQNKVPILRVQNDYDKIFYFKLNENKDGNLMLSQALDYETKNSYTFDVTVSENLGFTAENKNFAITSAQVKIIVSDVNEPPVFTRPTYNFTVVEEQMVSKIGFITAKDPDRANEKIWYSIIEEDCPINIEPLTGQLSTQRKLDRELQAVHTFQVEAREMISGLTSKVWVNIIVQDINDNPPELDVEDIFVCENDNTNTVIGILRAADKDDQKTTFTFKLTYPSSNFSIKDYGNSTAAVMVKQGPFSLEDPNEYSVDVSISDGSLSSSTKVAIKSCQCDARRIPTHCRAGARRMGVSVHALIAILLCILTILVIVILFVMRKRYQKDSLASMKNSGEIHEQLVTYDEEGGGEMDTNGYDVSILTSACNDGSMLRHPDRHPHPSLYAMVQKPHHLTQPTACKGDMAAMIEVKKDEADHDRDGFPYDTLHIYGYEGPESLAGSLSSLESSSTGSNLDYDFLNEWGPRFRALAELYGVDGSDYYRHY